MKLKCLLNLIVVCLLLSPIGVKAGEWTADNKTNCKVWNNDPQPNESVSWSGECVNGYASGSGILIWYKEGKETDRYEGQMNNGKRTGKGAYTWADGGKYVGDFVNDNSHGKGTRTWARGDRYEGDFVNDKRTGKGIYICRSGQRYTGDFQEGNPVGFTIRCN